MGFSKIRKRGKGEISIGNYAYYWSKRSYGECLRFLSVATSSLIQFSIVGTVPDIGF